MNKFIFELWTKYLPVVIGLLLTVSVTSCVYDDKAADCDNVILRFIYYADGEENVIQDYLYGIDVYIFDGKGKLVAKAHLTEQEIRAGTPLELDLPDGTYHAVAFGNDFDNTSLENILTPVDLERISMYNPNSEKQTNDRNYFGKHTFEVTSSEEYFRPVVEETVEMKSAHTELRIGVKGLPGPKNPDQMPYYIELSGAAERTSIGLYCDGTRIRELMLPNFLSSAETGMVKTGEILKPSLSRPRGISMSGYMLQTAHR